MTTILAIDPGQTSGFILGQTLEAKPHVLPYLAAWGSWIAIHEVEVHVHGHTDVIVIEDYRVYSHKARQHIGSRVITAKVIGAIEYAAHHHEPPIPVHLQPAAQAKGQWPNTRLRKHYHRKTLRQFKSKHVLDALRHLLTYIENHTPTGHIIATDQEAI